jgi:peroxiredoxin
MNALARRLIGWPERVAQHLQWVALIGVLAIGTAAGAVPDDPHNVTPIDINTAAPKFVAKEVDGRAFRFDPASLRQPTLIIFYRGGWCPYCNAQLQDLHTVVPQIVAMGYQVLFLSTDQPSLLYSSLKEKVDYHLLSDSSMDAAHAFGVAFHVDAATLAKMKTYGVDLDATQGTDRHELPVPSVFIVDRSGVVRFRHYDPDYTVRLDAAHVLAAAKSAQSMASTNLTTLP